MKEGTLRLDGDPRPALVYPCGEPPAAGEARQIAPGIFWLRMPMPLGLDHINLWAMRDGMDWAAFDSGLQTVETANAWSAHFSDGGALRSGRLTRTFVTHMHPDHAGMAGWLRTQFGSRLWMTRQEYLMCRAMSDEAARPPPEDYIDFYRRAGWAEAWIDAFRSRFGGFGKYMHVLPDSYRRLQDGDVFTIGGYAWHVVVGAGHSPEHACFYCPDMNVFIAGDQVLPRISSNVSVLPAEPDANPMADWLDSIDKIRRLVPDHVMVLPAHNEPFLGLHARLDYLKRSQLAALGRLRSALCQPARAVDIFETLFSRPVGTTLDMLQLATGESIAHLNYLLGAGEIAVEEDAAGVAWYRA